MKDTYHEINALVKESETDLTLEEMHGLLCGLLVSSPANTDVASYLALVIDDDRKPQNPALNQVLEIVFTTTQSDLQSPTLQFEPLLPDDDYPLDERMNAVTAWARGLVIGLANQGIEKSPADSGDTSDFIEDMYEVSQTEFQVTFDEESELIYSELVEYLKMGTLLLQEELNPVDLQSPVTLH